MRAFGEVAATLSAATDADAVMRVLARATCELLDIRRCSVYLREAHDELFHGRIVYDATHGEPPVPELDMRIKRIVAGTAADGFTDEILRTRHAVQLADAQDDPRPVRRTMRAWGIRSILGVPMMLRGEVIGLLFLDDGGSARVFSATEEEVAMTFAALAAVAISQANTTIQLRRGVQTIRRQNKLLHRASEMDDRLTQLVLDGANLSELAEAVSELTRKPCAIFDRDHHRLAAAMPDWVQGDGAPRMIDRAVLTHPLVVEAIGALGEKGSGALGPIPDAGLSHRCLLAPIGTREDSWGSLVITEHGSRFGALDLHIARRAATNAAFQLAAERRAALAECDARASLASELVRGPADPAATTRRAEYLGVDLAAPHAVCLIGHAAAGARARLSALDITAILEESGVDCAVLTTSTAEGVVVVLALDPDLHRREAIATVRDQVAGALELMSSEVRLAAGVSTRCMSPSDYVRAHQEARQVLNCLQVQAGDPPGLVLTADDLGPGRLFLASASREEATRFAHDALGPLLAPGNDAMADLLDTLRVFFDRARSVRRSAEALGVHENTIRYRLTRIEQLTRLAVASNSDDQLTAQLALLILRLQGGELGTTPAAAAA